MTAPHATVSRPRLDMSPMTPSRSSVRLALALSAGVLALSSSGCVAHRHKETGVFWPLPPETTRVKWIAIYRTAPDLEQGGWRRFTQTFTPQDPRAAITEPTGLALSADETRLYVVSAPKARVIRVDFTQGTMDVFAQAGQATPRAPYAVAVDAEDNVYVTDRGDSAIAVFRKDGSFVGQIGRGKAEIPGAIAIDRRRQQLYVICGATQKTEHRIEVFSLKGEHLRTIGRRGEGPGEFNFPSSLAVAPDGNLYVVDMLNFRIQVFSPEGELQTMFGQIGAGAPGSFEKAKGIAFDGFGNLYVVDGMHEVQIFNPKFQPLMAFGDWIVNTGGPIAISSTNEIFVGDYSRAGVHRFRLVNTAAADSYAPSDPAAKPAGAPAARPGDAQQR